MQVMLLNAPLKGIAAEEHKKSKSKKLKKGTAAATAEEFLKAHRTAKIVVVIDTHCLDNRYFVYTGDSADEYKACSLKEVSIPWT